MRAWTFQDTRQKQKLGSKAPWSVGWIDPDGKRRSKRIGSKSIATKYARKLEGQVAAGTYQSPARKQWAAFCEEYDQRILGTLDPDSRRLALGALKQFQQIIKPVRLTAIKTQAIDDYIAHRRTARGRKRGSTIASATLNKELRCLKAALRVAHDWGYLPVIPKFRMVKEPKELPRYVTPGDFAAIYQACDVATRPDGGHYSPGDWWRGLLTFLYMTGWRIGETLSLRWDDVSLDNGQAITQAQDNKAGRGEMVPLHPVVVDHLRKLVDFGPTVFSWPHDQRALYRPFARIQRAAGIHLPCHQDHEHTHLCHVYGFHDFRRAFATCNAETLSADALQTLMRHKSYQTTQRYINLAGQVNRAVEQLHVPEVLRKTS